MTKLEKVATAVVISGALIVGAQRVDQLLQKERQKVWSPVPLAAAAEAEIQKPHRMKIEMTDQVMTFIDSSSDKAIGMLVIKDKHLYFTGSAYPTAHAFFNIFLKETVDDYIAENCKGK